MRVLVCGGRDFTDRALLFNRLNMIHSLYSITEIISGGARGADTLAEEWADENNIPKTIVKADWKTHGKAAGPIRNQQMLDLKPNMVVAFPGGNGTADMVRRSKKANFEVIEVYG